MKIFLNIIAIGMMLFVIYGFWILGKKWDYHFGYEAQVEASIRAMVKPSCLVTK